MLSVEDLREIILYNRKTGLFAWKKSRRGVQIGKTLGTDNGFGYLRITVLGRSYYAHRLAWFYVHGEWPITIDHLNGVKSDNRITNLRGCSQSDNKQNVREAQANSKSKILGVSWHKKAKKWQAHICIYKERKYLGLFSDIFEAQKVYLKEREKHNVRF